jgi:hypothetical protein
LGVLNVPSISFHDLALFARVEIGRIVWKQVVDACLEDCCERKDFVFGYYFLLQFDSLKCLRTNPNAVVGKLMRQSFEAPSPFLAQPSDKRANDVYVIFVAHIKVSFSCSNGMRSHGLSEAPASD